MCSRLQREFDHDDLSATAYSNSIVWPPCSKCEVEANLIEVVSTTSAGIAALSNYAAAFKNEDSTMVGELVVNISTALAKVRV